MCNIRYYLKMKDNILYKIYRTNVLISSNTVNSDRREAGLQIANFQERHEMYKQHKARQQAIKNQTWLG